MIGVLRADPPPETADFGAGAAEQAAVQQLAIDNLVQATVAGDIVARDRLLAAVYPLLLGYCRGRLGHHTSVIGSADDVAQEVCLAVVTALPSYVISGRSFQAFCLRHRRAQSRRRLPRDGPQPHRAVAELPDRPVLHDGPEQRLLAGELAERLAGLLELLTRQQREVLILRVAVGLSAEETAEAVGSTPGAPSGSPNTAPSIGSALRSPGPAQAIVPPPLAVWLSFACTTRRDGLIAPRTVLNRAVLADWAEWEH